MDSSATPSACRNKHRNGQWPISCSFIEPDLFDNNVPFDNITPIYLINLRWKLGLGLVLDSELHYFNIFRENNKNEYLIFREFYGR